MIRRDMQLDDGSRAWALISQVEHARVAAELATDWGSAAVECYPRADVVLPTVLHHDDGWAEWEAQPTIDPATGKPRADTEMPNDEAHNIWRRSIERVGPWGPLAQFMVARHFMRLRMAGDEPEEESVRAFLSEFGPRCDRWREEFIAAARFAHDTNVPELAVGFLQTFDLFSLYLCCTPSRREYQLPLPNGGVLALTIAAGEVTVDPWPWEVSEKNVQTLAAQIPATPLTSDAELRDRMNVAQIELGWRLKPM